jgi:hypothetical protein
MICKVNATLSAEATVLRKLEGLTATLWDADPVKDDRLASAAVKDGKVEFLLDLEDASSLDSPAETQPDLFITVTDCGGTVLFQSETHKNADFSRRDPVSGDAKTTLDLIFSG